MMTIDVDGGALRLLCDFIRQATTDWQPLSDAMSYDEAKFTRRARFLEAAVKRGMADDLFEGVERCWKESERRWEESRP